MEHPSFRALRYYFMMWIVAYVQNAKVFIQDGVEYIVVSTQAWCSGCSIFVLVYAAQRFDRNVHPNFLSHSII